ncbi:MAG: hypothetical protein GX493_08400, partial [Firmicutes bacterium]|nr:hypothetical protein [Bacillota bacterium]
MKDLTGKIFLLGGFLLLIGMGFLGNRVFFKHHTRKDVPKNTNIKAKPEENHHKYG